MSADLNMPGGEPPQATLPEVSTDAAATVEGSAGVESDAGAVQSGGKDWEREAKHHQRLHNQLVDKLGPMRGLLDQANGAQLLPMITAWDRAVNHPELGPLLRQWSATGQVQIPKSTPEEPDPFEDETQRATRMKVEALERELVALKQTNSSVVSAQGAAKVRDHLVNLYQEYPEMTEEERGSFESAFQARIASLHNTDSGRNLLLNMDRTTFESFALPSLKPVLPTLIERRIAKKSGQIAAAATDAPLRTQTNGHEPTAIPPAQGLRAVNTEALMVQALAEARRMSGSRSS